MKKLTADKARIKELEAIIAQAIEDKAMLQTALAAKARGTCPVCTRLSLVQIGDERWACLSRRCNSEFFIEGEPGQRMLNVKDRFRRGG
jgi:ribosomal protein L37AE/L43A